MAAVLDPEKIVRLVKEENYEELFAYCSREEYRQNPDANYWLGYCWRYGKGTDIDMPRAVSCYKKAMEQGSRAAARIYADCLYDGIGVAEDKEQAVKIFKQAAENGDVMAQYNYAYACDNGIGIAQDPEEAGKWYRKASEWEEKKPEWQDLLPEWNINQQCAARAEYNLGYRCSEEKPEPDRAGMKKWWLRAALRESAKAQYALGIWYSQEPENPMNRAEAIKWYKRAAKQGMTEAQYNLACCYEEEKNWQEAVKWYREAGENGSPEALNNLGRCLYRYYPERREEAVQCFEKALKQGFAEAKYNYALCLIWEVKPEENLDEIFARIKELDGLGEAETIKVKYWLGLYFHYCGELETAKVFYGKAMKQDYMVPESIFDRIDSEEKLPREEFLREIEEVKKEELLYVPPKSDFECERERIKALRENEELKKRIAELEKAIDHCRMVCVESREKLKSCLADFRSRNGDTPEPKAVMELMVNVVTIMKQLDAGVGSAVSGEDEDAGVSELFGEITELLSGCAEMWLAPGVVNAAERTLMERFGEDIWNRKFDDFTRKSLKSARVLWNLTQSCGLGDSIDYSGVCISATTALEKVLTEIFAIRFQDFLINKRQKVEKDLPGKLKRKQKTEDDRYIWVRSDWFELGTIYGILTFEQYDAEDERNTFFAEILQGATAADKIRNDFAEKIHTINEKYRNPSAHTQYVNETTAKECYEKIAGAEAILFELFTDILKEDVTMHCQDHES